jgi:hypothetical protein
MTPHFWSSRLSNIGWFRDTQGHCHCLLSARLSPDAEKFAVKMSYPGQPGMPQLASSLDAFAVRTRCST